MRVLLRVTNYWLPCRCLKSSFNSSLQSSISIVLLYECLNIFVIIATGIWVAIRVEANLIIRCEIQATDIVAVIMINIIQLRGLDDSNASPVILICANIMCYIRLSRSYHTFVLYILLNSTDAISISLIWSCIAYTSSIIISMRWMRRRRSIYRISSHVINTSRYANTINTTASRYRALWLFWERFSVFLKLRIWIS